MPRLPLRPAPVRVAHSPAQGRMTLARLAFRHVPVDVFQHHHAVVQGHAYGERHARQGDHIDGATADQQAQKSGDGADGNADGADQGGGGSAQKQKQDEQDQRGAEQQILPDIRHRIGDIPHIVAVQHHA